MPKGWALTTALAFALIAMAARPGWAREKQARLTLDDLPKAVKATILKEAKGAKIEEIERETEHGKVVYEAEFTRNGKEVEISVDASGKLLSTEVEVTLEEVPKAVKATILKEAKGAKIEEIERETAGKKTTYEVEFEVDGKEIEIRIDPSGKVLSREVEEENDDEEDEDEEEVTIDQVPPAVKATILKEAKGAKIEEIEKETKKGKTVYEAEFVVDGKEIEIKVAPDGKLLSREVEDEDDDD